MTQLIVMALSMGILTAIGMAALVWGVDSRPTYRDDHARSTKSISRPGEDS